MSIRRKKLAVAALALLLLLDEEEEDENSSEENEDSDGDEDNYCGDIEGQEEEQEYDDEIEEIEEKYHVPEEKDNDDDDDKENYENDSEENYYADGGADVECSLSNEPLPVHEQEVVHSHNRLLDDGSDPVPMYVPPPSKNRKRKRKPSAVDPLEGPVATTSRFDASKQYARSRKRFWSQKMYLARTSYWRSSIPDTAAHLDPTEEKRILRMSDACFDELLNLVTPLIQRQATLMREPISPRQKLVGTLRYLATGQSFQALKFSTLSSPSALGNYVPETCVAIAQVLQPQFMKFPSNKEDWQKIAYEFSEICDFPNCGGALNGRHVRVLKTPETKNHGNHLGYCSIVLAALVDANHRFLSAEVILTERYSDESAIRETDLFKGLEENGLDLPGNGETQDGLDFVFVAPSGFPPHDRILTEYPVDETHSEAANAFNAKIERLNQCSNNALGLLASRFGIFRSNIQTHLLWKIEPIVMACCAIHNFLSIAGSDEYIAEDTYDRLDESGNMVSGEWRKDADAGYQPLEPIVFQPLPETDRIREEYAQYFNQDRIVVDIDRLTA